MTLAAVDWAGGLGRAASAVRGVADAVTIIAQQASPPAQAAASGSGPTRRPPPPRPPESTPAFDQYGTDVTICHQSADGPRTIRVSASAATQYIAQGDYVGPCA